MKIFQLKNTLLYFILSITYLVSSCKEDEEKESKINVSFEKSILSVNEDEDVRIRIILEKPAIRNEYVTISVGSGTAIFGSDYGVDNLLFMEDGFSILIPKDSTTASFLTHANADYVTDPSETVLFNLQQTTEGLAIGTANTTTVSITDVVNFTSANRAITFDGVDDYIDLGNIYDNLALPLTISAWVWIDPTAPAGLLPIFDSQDGLPLYDGFTFITSTASNVGIQYGDGLGENSSVYRRAKSSEFYPLAGRWINMTGIMRSANDMSIFLNGVETTGFYAGESNSPMKSNSPTEHAKIGIETNNGTIFRFKGKLDEIRVWNRALTPAEIQKSIITKLDSSAPGLIGYWDFNEASGEMVYDKSANGFHGVIKGNPARVPSEAPVE